jgi:hypothetical protein
VTGRRSNPVPTSARRTTRLDAIERPERMPEVPVRELVDLGGKRVGLALEGARSIERRGRAITARTFADPVRAFVAVANRARRLVRDGFAELTPTTAVAEPLVLASWDALVAYASRLDERRSLPQQELLLACAITPDLDRRDPRFGRALATLALLEWPSTFDVGGALATLDEPDLALADVLERELASEPKAYPMELVRLTALHGSARGVGLALSALSRTRDADAWLDVLIEGDPFFDSTHVPALEALGKRAPSRDVARILREIAAEHTPRRKRR